MLGLNLNRVSKGGHGIAKQDIHLIPVQSVSVIQGKA